MSLITPAQLGQYINQTLSAAEQLQAQFAIDNATAIVSDLLCFNVDPTIPVTNAIPSELSMIGAGSCGTITSGKFKKFIVSGTADKIITEPFNVIRQVILAQPGRNYTGTNTCTSGLIFIQPYQYVLSLNGKMNTENYNMLKLVRYADFDEICGCEMGVGTIAFIDADWGWKTNAMPDAIKGFILAVANEIYSRMSLGGIKSENIDGHNYTLADMPDYAVMGKQIANLYGACSFNAL